MSIRTGLECLRAMKTINELLKDVQKTFKYFPGSMEK